MSGGSFNYLDRVCYGDLHDIAARLSDIEDMAEALGEYDGDRAALAQAMTHAIAWQMRSLERTVTAVARSMVHVWHAVEWHRSADWSEDQVHAALATLLPNTPGPSSAEGTS